MALIGLDPEEVRTLADTFAGQADAAEESARRIQTALVLCDMTSDVPDRLVERGETWRDAATELHSRADLAEAFRLGLPGSTPNNSQTTIDRADTPTILGPPAPSTHTNGLGWADAFHIADPIDNISISRTASGSYYGYVTLRAGTGPGGITGSWTPYGIYAQTSPRRVVPYGPSRPLPGGNGLRVLRAIRVAGTAYDFYDSYQLYDTPGRSRTGVIADATARTAASTVGAAAGFGGGCALGGAAGSFIAPGPGTAIGCGATGGGFAVLGSQRSRDLYDQWIRPTTIETGDAFGAAGATTTEQIWNGDRHGQGLRGLLGRFTSPLP